MTQHSDTHKGLQNHSIGDAYPWTISAVDTSKGLYWYAWNCVSGEKLDRWVTYRCAALELKKHLQGESMSYAEDLADLQLSASNSQPEPEPEPLVEYTFLIPSVRDDNRQFHANGKWQWLNDKLHLRFGGFTTAGIVCGSWQDSKGKTIYDKSRVYRVAIPTSRLNELLDVLELCKFTFCQQTIYLALTSSRVTIS